MIFFAGIFLVATAVVGAAIQTFDGTGKYIMSDFEDTNIAQQRAIQRAKIDAQDKAGVYLTGFSQSVNARLTVDEISAVTNNIIDVFDVDVQAEPFEVQGETGIIWTATLKANIDPDGIFDWLKRDDKEKVTIVQQNDSLQDAIEKNDKQVEDLKEQYNRATSQAEKDSIIKQMNDTDRDFLANQKLNEGNMLYYKNNYSEAINVFTEAIKINPNLSEAYSQRGKSYESLKNYDAAIKDLRKAVELNPKDDSAYLSLGVIYEYEKENHILALESFKKIIELRPEDGLGYESCAHVYHSIKDYNNAIVYYSKAIDINRKDLALYYFRAKNYEKIGNYEQAIKDYTKIIEIQPYIEAYYNRGNAYGRLGNYEQAIRDYNKVIELNPNLSVAYSNRGSAYAMTGNFKEAIKNFDKYIQFVPNDAIAYQRRGICYRELGDEAKAQADFAKAKELGYKD